MSAVEINFFLSVQFPVIKPSYTKSEILLYFGKVFRKMLEGVEIFAKTHTVYCLL